MPKLIFKVIALATLIVWSAGFSLSYGQQKPATPGKQVINRRNATPSGLSPNEPTAQRAVPGRYLIVFSPHARADMFLLDTETGKIWSRVQISDVVGKPELWKFEQRIESDQEFTEWGAHQTFEVKPPK